MPWDPKIYNQFKNIRYQPFFDLMSLIGEEGVQSAVDIGCGTGEQTSILSQRFEHASFIGIDSSEEMLAGSEKFATGKLSYAVTTIEDFAASGSTYDLIFSNAALQWSDDHATLFPQLISKLNNNGQFAIQMPWQKENVLNKILLDIVNEKPFVDFLGGFRRGSPLLTIDEYASIMFACDLKDFNVSLKIYPIIAADEIELYNFISGSALIPYMERLQPQQQELLKTEFVERIKMEFKNFPAIYAFKRLLLYGRKR